MAVRSVVSFLGSNPSSIWSLRKTRGVSTRSVDELVRAMGGAGISKSQVIRHVDAKDTKPSGS